MERRVRGLFKRLWGRDPRRSSKREANGETGSKMLGAWVELLQES